MDKECKFNDEKFNYGWACDCDNCRYNRCSCEDCIKKRDILIMGINSCNESVQEYQKELRKKYRVKNL